MHLSPKSDTILNLFEYDLSPIILLFFFLTISRTGTVLIFIPILFNIEEIEFIYIYTLC